MTEYWPDKQGIALNNEVARLFLNTKQKFAYNLSNTTNKQLYIDILDNSCKYKLFSVVLTQLEILLLDIIELDLTIKNIQLLNHKILYDLIQKSLVNFINILQLENSSIELIDKLEYFYLQTILLEHQLLLENVLIYLTFGTSCITSKLFAFDNHKTPKRHVSILLENLIIQVSNSVIFMIFESIKSMSQIIYFLINNQICNSVFISTRSIALFRNNLIWQNLLQFYIIQPKAIYNARYQVWLISKNGLSSKYIYVYRINDLSKLSKPKRVFIFTIEIQDLIVPQIEKFILISGRILVYILINIIGNSAILIIRTIISSLYKIQK